MPQLQKPSRLRANSGTTDCTPIASGQIPPKPPPSADPAEDHMAFHPRKVLSHLSLELGAVISGPPSLRSWRKPPIGKARDIEVRQRLEQLLLASSGTRAELIASLQRVFHMGSSGGDRAMIAACGSDVLLRQELRSGPTRTSAPSGCSATVPSCSSGPRASASRTTATAVAAGPGSSARAISGLTSPASRSTCSRRGSRPRSGSSTAPVAHRRGAVRARSDQHGRYGEGRVFQLLAYLEGMPATSNEFGDGRIVRRNVRPAIRGGARLRTRDRGHRRRRQRRAAAARGGGQGVRRRAVPAGSRLQPVRLREVALAGLARPRASRSTRRTASRACG